MSETMWGLISALPAVLVALGAWLAHRAGPPERAGQRLLTYLLVAGTLLAGAIGGADLLDGTPEVSYTAQMVERVLAPAVITALALIILNLKALAGLTRKQHWGYGVLIALLLAAQAVAAFRTSFLSYMLLPAALAIAALWLLLRASGWLLTTLSLLTLTALSVVNFATWPALAPPDWPRWATTTAGIIYLVAVGLAAVLPVVFLSTGIARLGEPAGENPTGARARRWSGALRLALAAIVFGALLYTIVWMSIWDHTSDGLGGLLLLWISSPAAIAAGIILGVKSRGSGRAAGFAFAVLAPLLCSFAFHYGWGVSYHAITEQRAARIQRAVERYQQRTGGYPTDLAALTPRDLLWIPNPIILRGESWCYQGGADFYRLTTFYRQIWGMPFSLKVYASAGDPPAGAWACEDELAALKAERDPPPIYEQELNAGVQTGAQPQPTSVIPLPRTPALPLIKAKVLYTSDWSLDGQYLAFGQPDVSAEPHRLVLRFLDVRAGALCQAEVSFPGVVDLNGHHAWLPDGRLLFLNETGALWAVTPCQEGSEARIADMPEPFALIEKADKQGAHILLRGQSAYWILDGRSLGMVRLAEVAPDSDGQGWGRAAWSPDGQRLAFTRLNGSDARDGSAIYIIDAASGETVTRVTLDDTSNPYAPYVEWLDQDELLATGRDLWRIDLSASPPTRQNVLRDLFDLDAAYPNDFTGMAAVMDPSGAYYHLLVRLDLPRNQAIYLYHGETGQVEVIQPDADPLLAFPDGELVNMRAVRYAAPAVDAFEWIAVDGNAQEPFRLTVEGHLPRSYPDVNVKYLPGRSQLAFASLQGVSLAALPGGEMLQFWELRDRSLDTPPSLRVAPGEEGLLVVADFDGVYYIPLDAD